MKPIATKVLLGMCRVTLSAGTTYFSRPAPGDSPRKPSAAPFCASCRARSTGTHGRRLAGPCLCRCRGALRAGRALRAVDGRVGDRQRLPGRRALRLRQRQRRRRRRSQIALRREQFLAELRCSLACSVLVASEARPAPCLAWRTRADRRTPRALRAPPGVVPAARLAAACCGTLQDTVGPLYGLAVPAKQSCATAPSSTIAEQARPSLPIPYAHGVASLPTPAIRTPRSAIDARQPAPAGQAGAVMRTERCAPEKSGSCMSSEGAGVGGTRQLRRSSPARSGLPPAMTAASSGWPALLATMAGV